MQRWQFGKALFDRAHSMHCWGFVFLGVASLHGCADEKDSSAAGAAGAMSVGSELAQLCPALCDRANVVAQQDGCVPLEPACPDRCASEWTVAGCEAQVNAFVSCYHQALDVTNCHCETDGSINCEEIYKDDEHPSGVAPCSAQATAAFQCEEALMP